MKNIKLKKQSGMAIDELLFWIIVPIAIICTFYGLYMIYSQKQEAMKSLESKGYSLIRDFDHSDKSLPSSDLLSKCVGEEYILIDNMNEQVEKLQKAGGIMCRLKENK